jgi:hypothetical protein
MAHNYAINDDVHHQLQGPQGRAVTKQRSVYTIVSRLPIEADGRPRYRIKSKTENVERVVTEEQISRLGWSGWHLRKHAPVRIRLHCPAQGRKRRAFE